MFPLILGLIFLSGAAAMVYELLWARWLMLAFGAGAGSVALAVAGTMLGLGLGSEAGGRLADRAGSGLRLYGFLECLVAVAALAASFALSSAAEPGFLPSSPRWLAMPAALALIGLPAAFMGATLPALAAHFGRHAGFQPRLGRLYAANVAGAVAGALAAGFFLIERLGLRGSALAAAAANLLAGSAALALGSEGAVPAKAGVVERKDAGATRAALVAAAVSGFTTLAYEVLDTRLLVHGLLNTTHALTVILATFLAGLALGARLCAGRLKASRALAGEMGVALLAAAGLALAMAPSLTETSALAALLRSKDAGWGARVAFEAAIAGTLLLPGTVLMGFVFPAAVALGAPSGQAGSGFGRVSMVNALAGVAGALGAGFVLLPDLGLRASLAATAALQAGAGAWLAAREPLWPVRARGAAWGAFSVLLLGGCLWASPARLGSRPGRGTLVPPHVVGREAEYQVLCYREGALATTQVLKHLPDGRRELDIDGFIAAGEAPAAGYMALMGRLPMRIHPGARRALVICFGTGTTARAVAAEGSADIDVADIDPNVFACAPSFGEENARLLSQARLSVEDGREFLRRKGPPYDVITQEPMPPYFAGTAALYSTEYYRLARRRLSPDGLLVQWLPLHLVAPKDARQIVASALEVFPETWVALASGDGTGLVITSMKPLDARRLRGLEGSLAARFVLDPGGARRYAAGVEPVTDDRPALEYSGIDRVRGAFGGSKGLHGKNLSDLMAAAGEKSVE